MQENNKFFLLYHGKEVSLSATTNVLKEQEVGHLINSIELIDEAKKDSSRIISETNKECELIKEKAYKEGFEKGMSEWASILKSLENEHDNIRIQMESIIIKIAIKAAQTIIGKQLEEDPAAFSLIVAQSLKTVSEHKSINIYCSTSEYDSLMNSKKTLQDILANANTFSITPKAGLPPMGYIIQTEKGIVNGSDPEKIWENIEKVFSEQLDNMQKVT